MSRARRRSPASGSPDATAAPSRVPRGHPMPDAELMAMADVTDADVERAKAAWRQDAPAGAKQLLDADRVNDSVVEWRHGRHDR